MIFRCQRLRLLPGNDVGRLKIAASPIFYFVHRDIRGIDCNCIRRFRCSFRPARVTPAFFAKNKIDCARTVSHLHKFHNERFPGADLNLQRIAIKIAIFEHWRPQVKDTTIFIAAHRANNNSPVGAYYSNVETLVLAWRTRQHAFHVVDRESIRGDRRVDNKGLQRLWRRCAGLGGSQSGAWKSILNIVISIVRGARLSRRKK